MSDYNRNAWGQAAGQTTAANAAVDQGLRSYMLTVYNYMAIGLAITGAAAIGAFMLAVSSEPTGVVARGMHLTQFGVMLYTSPLKWVVLLAPLGMVFFLSARLHTMSANAGRIAFFVFAGLMGLSLSSIFLVYTGASISRVFFITAAAFGALSLYGYTTKKDLTGMGSFLVMGLFGIIIASLVNIFIGSTMVQFVVSVLGVLIFSGLTAYDTQRIKEMYYALDDDGTMSRKAILGALSLYLDFINLFTSLLSLFGNRN
ncbi:Bax inhibitor-1/YccA family protein [Methylopila sp. M107]|uniref:Bax inhibitor-1/YccA family protein n=1 Tax=Methylopila sp. M107 TaxID=1101190 RepID=UPI0003616DD0|nr:Bax inhibitor-1/YccA family protein [Methylopila sp. M107]